MTPGDMIVNVCLAWLPTLSLLIAPILVVYFISRAFPSSLMRCTYRLIFGSYYVLVLLFICGLPLALIVASDMARPASAAEIYEMGNGRSIPKDAKVGRLYKDEAFSNSSLHGLAGYEGVDVVGSGAIKAPISGIVIKSGCDTYSAAGLPGHWHPVCGRKATWLEIQNEGQRAVLLHGEYSVKEGDRVRIGDEVGTQACFGWCTGDHTHIILYDEAGKVQSYAALIGSEPVVPVISPAAPDAHLATLVDALAAIEFPAKTAVSQPAGFGKLRISHYTPYVNGVEQKGTTNCDSDCSRMASGDATLSWSGGINGIYAAACPGDWPFGTRFEVYGKVYECRDRGGWIRTRTPGEWDDAMGGFVAAETYHWVDLLDSAPVPYGTLESNWRFVK